MKRQRIKYKNKQVSTYKNYYITQNNMAGDFGSVKKKRKKDKLPV